MTRWLLILTALLALPASAAPVDSSELARCHALGTRDERLECYEALTAGAMSVGVASAGTSTAAPAVTGPVTPPASPAETADPGAHFGLSQRQIAPHPTGPDSVKSVVSQMTEDRLHKVTVLLENGQTWTFVEAEPRLRPGDAVTVKNAAFGSFLMLTPSRHSYRVERSK